MGNNRGQRRGGAAKAVRRTRTAQVGTAVVFCGLAALGGMPRAQAEAASAPNPAPADGTISMRIVDADIHAVVSFLQSRTKVNVIVVEGEHPYKRVNVFLNNASPDKALAYIAASAGAVMSVSADGVYILHPASGQADAGGAPDEQTRPRYKPSDFRPYKLYLKHVSPDAVLKKLEWTQTLHEDDSATDVEAKVSQRGSKFTTFGPSLNIFPQAGYGGPPTLYQQPTVPAGHGSTGLNQANDEVSAGRSVNPSDSAQAQQFPGFNGGGNNGFNGGGNNGFNGGGNNGFNGGVGNGRNGQQQLTLPEGVDRLYAIEGDNSLLVFSTVDGFNLVKEIVKNLDIAPRQVSIKVEFVTASVHDVDQFGINFSLIPVPNVQALFTPATNSGASGASNSFIQFQYGNVAAQLYALLQNTRSKLVQAPIISTTNNVPAFIIFQQQIPFQTNNTTIVPNGGTVTTTSQNLQTISSELPVTPRINGDDTVTLDLQPQISAPTGPAIGNGPAPTSTQYLQTTRTVRSGETMVLGGLVTKTDNYTLSRIPILGDLPIIGSFFRSRAKDINDQELLIFVTPTIIDEDSTSSGITSAPQGELGVNGAPGDQPNPGGQVAP